MNAITPRSINGAAVAHTGQIGGTADDGIQTKTAGNVIYLKAGAMSRQGTPEFVKSKVETARGEAVTALKDQFANAEAFQSSDLDPFKDTLSGLAHA